MFKVGIIGCGRRISTMAKRLSVIDVPYKIAAIADPKKEEIKSREIELYKDAVYYETADEMLDKEKLDGVMIGTRCNLHTEMACKVAKYNIPLFLEKPVSIDFDQVKALQEAFENVTAPVVVSFPLRFIPMTQTVKQVIESGTIGKVKSFAAFNDVPGGKGYFHSWYRDFNYAGGLWLQKATHDIDCISYLLNQPPKWICAMETQAVFGGDKPFDLQCKECEMKESCTESPFNLSNQLIDGVNQNWDEKRKEINQYCVFAKEIKNHDLGNCIIEYDNGIQGTYHQNFFVKQRTLGRRGMRLYGEKGVIYFDWYKSQIKLYSYTSTAVNTMDFPEDLVNDYHWGGDKILAYDFLMAMKGKKTVGAPLSAGITSALTCLCARESSRYRKFYEVKLPI